MEKQLTELTMENILVKSNCKKQFKDKKYWEAQHDLVINSALNYITDEENMFKFADEIGLNHQGLYYTTINEYTTKCGKTFNAHYTYYGKYFGKTCNNSNIPKLITCYMPVSKEYFTFDNTKEGMKRFIPIEPKNPTEPIVKPIEEPIEEPIKEPIEEPIVKKKRPYKKKRYTLDELDELGFLRMKTIHKVDKRCKAFKRGFVDEKGELIIE
tara:strand:+ start:157 stop:792 length:636 start_codon:yes stop_codon:yes gene_type:complete